MDFIIDAITEWIKDFLIEAITGNLSNMFGDVNTKVATEAHALTESEEAECRRRIAAILRTIEGGADEYLDYLDGYLKDYQERYHENAE